MVSEGGYENTCVIAARFDGIWRPMHALHKNKFIQISRTLSVHWFDLVPTLSSSTLRKWQNFEGFQSILIMLDFRGRYGLNQVPPNTLMVLFWLENHFRVITLGKWSFLRSVRRIITLLIKLLRGYRLSQVIPTLHCSWFVLRTIWSRIFWANNFSRSVGDARIQRRECNNARAGCWEDSTQSITPTEVRLNSVARWMVLENDQNGPESYNFNYSLRRRNFNTAACLPLCEVNFRKFWSQSALWGEEALGATAFQEFWLTERFNY